MPARTRKGTATTTEDIDPTTDELETAPDADATAEGDASSTECIVKGCEEQEQDGHGVCQPHYDAGWRYVREPKDD